MKRAIATVGAIGLAFVVGAHWGAYRALRLPFPEYIRHKAKLEGNLREMRKLRSGDTDA